MGPIVAAVLAATIASIDMAQAPGIELEERPPQSVARLWNEELLALIRQRSSPPPLNARNLFHLSIAMYDAWAVYDRQARPLIARERHEARDVERARREAISFAAYTFLLARFEEVGLLTGELRASLDDCLRRSCGGPPDAIDNLQDAPATVGRRVAENVLRMGRGDRSQLHDNDGFDRQYQPVNDELIYQLPGNPTCVDPNRWQPIAYDYVVLQTGGALGAAVQRFVCPEWGEVTPFCLDPNTDHVGSTWFDPGPPPQLGGREHDDCVQAHIELLSLSSQLDPVDAPIVDIGPATSRNSPLGTDDGQGRRENPVTGRPYDPVLANQADYFRSIAEYWADGPHSETPPGHWNALTNQHVNDHPLLDRCMAGTTEPVDPLEWDVKLYLALNGALHDAAIATWDIKGFYDGNRPIQVIRYMADRGQSADPTLPRHHPLGLPLIPGEIEQIRPQDVAPGERFAHLVEYREDPLTGRLQLDTHVGDIAIRVWRGRPANPDAEVGGVGWILASRFVPYQEMAQVTPPFGGYTSGHSCFSHAAAALLTAFTGSEFFPGGITVETVPKGWLRFEAGPTADVSLTWATYRDAADEAAFSRRVGGIHASYDDYPSRLIGAKIGRKAFEFARRLFTNTTGSPDINADGVVDAIDLGLAMEAWGCCPEPCPADLDADGYVDERDIAAILTSWSSSD